MTLPNLLRQGRTLCRVGWRFSVACCCLFAFLGLAAEPVATMSVQEGKVLFEHPPAKPVPATVPQQLKFGDRLETAELSWAVVEFIHRSKLKVRELSRLEIVNPAGKAGLKVRQGAVYSSDLPRFQEFYVLTPAGNVIPRGTEFLIEVREGRTRVVMFDGEAELQNERGQVVVRVGEEGVAELGQAPTTARLEARSLVQWWLYYPGVLDLEEVPFTPEERARLSASLSAYRVGALPDALRQFPGYPAAPDLRSNAEKVYYAALLLSVGAVGKAKAVLDTIDPVTAPARALRTLIDAVTADGGGLTRSNSRLETRNSEGPDSASEWLALSYLHQSVHDLENALAAASEATNRSPQFGFAWERVAELEFSFGRTRKARKALEIALQLAPTNAQAHALHGFLLSAENRINQALAAFDQAIRLDPGLGNAWLGRGLCRIRKGEPKAGRDDLQTAAILEPDRSLLHSYLGKALVEDGQLSQAQKELDFAKRLDSNDPTPWLYSALLKQQQNRINEAIGDLEASQELNKNRSLFRSRLLLDQDLAVSSANLASIYRDAGMRDVSVREASRAVTYDYANASAHLFLSDSYNELRDPTRFNLRYETVWFNELLLANLLSPIGGGRLAQHVSQQEYSSLFQADGLGFANSTLLRSDNNSIRELASQYGTFGGTSYAFDLDYQHANGNRSNNDLDSIEWYTTFKQQITPQDTLLALVKYEDYKSGDNFQYYDPHGPPRYGPPPTYADNPPPYGSRPNFEFKEYQQPIVVGGWHHEWSPNQHTLLLGGRIDTRQRFSDLATPQLVLIKGPAGNIYDTDGATLDVSYHNDMEIYLAELNQVSQWDRISLSYGGRWQGGSFDADSTFSNPGRLGFLFTGFDGASSVDESFQRLTGYGYLTVEPLDRLWLIGGAAYDDITYPDNFRNPPLSSGESHAYQLGPKAGLVWNPVSLATLRGAYTKSLGGVSADESYRLEQTQVAGFPQAFRSLISESIVGSVAAPEYETYSVALDFKFPSRTYLGILAQRLITDVDRTIGVFSLNGIAPAVASTTEEHLRYCEDSIGVGINQLLGQYFAVGTSFKYDHVKFKDHLPKVPVTALPAADRTDRANLYETTGYVLFNHPSGFFARADATWYHQHNSGDYVPGSGDDLVQENIFIGYRFLNRRAEITAGVLNLSDQGYHLYSLNAYPELPRDRSFVLRINFIF